jgi:hypothetical protein
MTNDSCQKNNVSTEYELMFAFVSVFKTRLIISLMVVFERNMSEC